MSTDASSSRGFDFALGYARDLMSQLRSLPFKEYEMLSPEASLEHLGDRALPVTLGALDEAAHLIAHLPQMLESGPVDIPACRSNYEGITADQPATAGVPEPPHDPFCQDIDIALDQMLADGATTENLDAECPRIEAALQKARDRIVAAVSGGGQWDVLCECEEARRRAEHGLYYMLTLAALRINVEDADSLFPTVRRELHRALAARLLLLNLRRDVIALFPDSVDDTTRPALANAIGVRLAETFDAEAYSELRALDRYRLHQHRTLIGMWAKDPSDTERGMELLEAARSFVDALQGINHRGILVAHDRRYRDRAIRRVRQLAAGESTVMEILATLRALWGRDEELDALVGKIPSAPTNADLAPVLDRLRALEI